MRITTLLLLAAAVLLLTTPAASFAQSIGSSKASSGNTGDNAMVVRPDGTSPDGVDPASARWNLRIGQAENVCFTMRTYVVVRESPNSDVTRPTGYHECLPSWKLEVRSSDEKPAASR